MQKLCAFIGTLLLCSSSFPLAAYAESSAQNNVKTNLPDKLEPSLPPQCNGESDCFILREKESLQLSDIGQVKLEKVLEDSRCPIDAICIWAGQVKVKISVKSSDLCGKNYLELGLGGSLLPTWTDEDSGLSISLQQVWPEKILQNPVEAPYQAKVRILRKNPIAQEEP